MLLLGLIHNLLNLPFWEHIGRGRYNRRRILLTVENVLLAVSMAAAVVSGFLFTPGFHRISALLFLILTVIHGGSHIKNADLILVMKDGDIIESGNHE